MLIYMKDYPISSLLLVTFFTKYLIRRILDVHYVIVEK